MSDLIYIDTAVSGCLGVVTVTTLSERGRRTTTQMYIHVCVRYNLLLV